jgi:hypothetical protein
MRTFQILLIVGVLAAVTLSNVMAQDDRASSRAERDPSKARSKEHRGPRGRRPSEARSSDEGGSKAQSEPRGRRSSEARPESSARREVDGKSREQVSGVQRRTRHGGASLPTAEREDTSVHHHGRSFHRGGECIAHHRSERGALSAQDHGHRYHDRRSTRGDHRRSGYEEAYADHHGHSGRFRSEKSHGAKKVSHHHHDGRSYDGSERDGSRSHRHHRYHQRDAERSRDRHDRRS